MSKSQLQDAKSRFSELIDETLEKGPQVVTRRGIDTAVIVPIEEWRKFKDERRLNWKDVLLGEGPRFSISLPKRGGAKSRKVPVFN
jgi:antitoxin Phd